MDSVQDFARIGCAHLLEWFGKVPKIGLWGDFGSTCWAGDLFGTNNGLEKSCLLEEWFCGGVLGESILPK